MTGWLKFLLELGPLAVFFITFTIFAPKTAEPEHVAPDRPVLEQPAAESGAKSVASGEKALADAEAARFEAELDALILATIAFMVALLISLVGTYWIDGSVSKVAVLTAVIVLVTGALTIILRDETFVKMKPTIAYGLFAVGLFVGLARGRSYLKDLMGELADMTDEGWMKLARNWALFFAFCAVLNEIIWRGFDTETWVLTKTFVYVPLIGIFAISQAPLMAAYEPKQSESGEAEA